MQAAHFNTDQEAIAAFLAEYKDSPATHRTYAREAERLHMWSVLWKNKSIADLTLEDFQEYLDFLESPDPAWVSKQKFRKGNPHWRPFVLIVEKRDDDDQTGLTHEPAIEDNLGLSDSAITVALAALGSMLNWLVGAGYLRMNTLALLRKDKRIRKSNSRLNQKQVSRFLDEDMWSAANVVVEKMPKETAQQIMHYERSRFILAMFSMLGPRVSEASLSTMNAFVNNGAGWFWQVTGKGDKDADVACPQDIIDALIRWRRALGLAPLPSSLDKRPVIPAVNKLGQPLFNASLQTDGDAAERRSLRRNKRGGISARRINQILKEIFISASNEPGLTEAQKAALRSASAHWLRHTSVTQKIHAGMAPYLVQEDARHSDIRTTNQYSHDKLKMRSQEAQKHRLKWKEQKEKF